MSLLHERLEDFPPEDFGDTDGWWERVQEEGPVWRDKAAIDRVMSIRIAVGRLVAGAVRFMDTLKCRGVQVAQTARREEGGHPYRYLTEDQRSGSKCISRRMPSY